ncbi:hypothetical protein BDV18DRAFT_136383 [Aspergillus unguis]
MPMTWITLHKEKIRNCQAIQTNDKSLISDPILIHRVIETPLTEDMYIPMYPALTSSCVILGIYSITLDILTTAQ